MAFVYLSVSVLVLVVHNFLSAINSSTLVNVTEPPPTGVTLNFATPQRPTCIPAHYNLTPLPPVQLVFADEPLDVEVMLALGRDVVFEWVLDDIVLAVDQCTEQLCNAKRVSDFVAAPCCNLLSAAQSRCELFSS